MRETAYDMVEALVGPAEFTLPDTHNYICELMKVNSNYHYDYNNRQSSMLSNTQ